jgi:hypothetical protein
MVEAGFPGKGERRFKIKRKVLAFRVDNLGLESSTRVAYIY